MEGFSRILIAVLFLSAFSLLTGCESVVQKNRELGVKLYDEQQYDQSMMALNKALADDQFDAVSNAYAGLIYDRSNNLVQAEYHFRVALQSDPSSEIAKAGLTTTLIRKGDPDGALDALERSAKLAEKVDDPRWQKTDVKRPYNKQVNERLYLGKLNDRLRIAHTYQQLGDYDNALVYYKKALEISPNNPTVLFSIADMAERAGNKTQAREYLRLTYLADPATQGLTEAMTRNGLAISDVLSGSK